MSKIAEKINSLNDRGEGALITYLMAGDPTPDSCLEYVRALRNGGADLIELGVPFSDPVADGPTIQKAGNRAIKEVNSPEKVLKLAHEIRKFCDIPLVLMSYYNPIMQFGEDKFFENCDELGIDGLITPDLPVEEAETYIQGARKYSLDTPFLVTPDTDQERLEEIADLSTGFLYIVARRGTTGARKEVGHVTTETIRSFSPLLPDGLPICAGFGLSTPRHVNKVINSGAHGAIVGSAIVEKIGSGCEPGEVEGFVKELKSGTIN